MDYEKSDKNVMFVSRWFTIKLTPVKHKHHEKQKVIINLIFCSYDKFLFSIFIFFSLSCILYNNP
jgi:hypothetical protein